MTIRPLFAFLFLLCPYSFIAVQGADNITLWPIADESSEPPNRVLRGTVEDILGGQLTMQIGPTKRTLAIDEVWRIESDWDTAHRQGDRLLEQQKWTEAIAAYQDAATREQRPWCRRLLARQLIVAHREAGDTVLAGELATRLWQLDPQTPYVEAFPLNWLAEQPDGNLRTQSATWMANRENDAARLIGTSWQLIGERRSAAIEVLQQLTEVRETKLAQMAMAQLWRTQIASAPESEVARWRVLIQRMPPTMRAGPYYVLGAAEAQTGLHEAAGVSFMRIPTAFPEQARLGVAALSETSRLMQQLGHDDQSERIQSEIRRRTKTGQPTVNDGTTTSEDGNE